MTLIPVVAGRILNSLPIGLIVALCMWLCIRAAGRQSSRARFALWFATLLTIAAVPLFHHPESSGAASVAEFRVSAEWANVFLGTWVFLFALAIVRLCFGLFKVHQLRRKARPINLAECSPLIRESIEQLQSLRRVSVCVSDEQSVPAALGFFKPIILLPSWALQELPPQELRSVLLHEFAHIERNDTWTNLAQKLIRAAFFFHPAVWWIDKRLCLEREMACDDAVLSATGDPRTYAACLVTLAEKTFVRRSVALAQTAVNRLCDTSLRVAEILKGDRVGSRSLRSAVLLFSSFGVACVALLPAAPQLIGFTESSTQSTAVVAKNSTPELPVKVVEKDAGSDSTRKPSVIPAAYKPRPTTKVREEHRRKLVASNSAVRTGNVHLAAAKPAPEMFLVVRTAQFDDFGRSLMTVTVWRISVDPNAVPADQSGARPKSI